MFPSDLQWSLSAACRHIPPTQNFAVLRNTHTDIEDSTHFWEVLESATMDSVFTLHHSCVRTTCAKWGGYESQTEGE